MTDQEYERLLALSNLIDGKRANINEKTEYMTLLYKNGNITKDQYDSFLAGRNSDDIVAAGLVIGTMILITWAIVKLLKG
jgi:hypothetical protein